MGQMVDPAGDAIAALETQYSPPPVGSVSTQLLDARLNAVKTAAAFVPGSEIIDPFGTETASLGGAIPSNALVINGVPLVVNGQFLTVSG
jgi:hypothetical protein